MTGPLERNDQAGEVRIPHDPVNEQVVLAAGAADADTRKRLLSRFLPDHFFAPEHRVIWAGFGELGRRNLELDLATLQKVAPKADVSYLSQLMQARPDVPANLSFHVEMMAWDHQRLTAVKGPIAALIDAVRDPSADPDRVRALSRQVAQSFDVLGDRKYLRNSEELVREQIAEIQARRDGVACYSYGIDRLDYFEEASPGGKAVRRMVPGPAPGQVTAIVGLPGSGKSTTTARIALGLARNKRRVLYGAWEMKGGITLELLACMSLGLSRSALLEGDLDGERLAKLEERMHAISKYVKFMDVPFNRVAGQKASNDRNLDIVQGYIADSGCDVFIADLWKRCLRHTDPGDEEQALVRQQAIAEEQKVHVVLVQQLRAKDVEGRADKRPTREGIKGSGAWIEVPDTILGVHRPALWKDVEDNVLEIDVLKQRYGKWPQAVEFDWNADIGLIAGGRAVKYDDPASSVSDSARIDEMFGRGAGRRKGRGGSLPPLKDKK